MTPVSIRKIAAAAVLLAPLGAAIVAQPAAAQHNQYRFAQAEPGQIVNMSLDSSAGLRPGATLRLNVYATPGARWANATLGDSGLRIRLVEHRLGQYVGTHLIERGERIDPNGVITVRAGWGEGPVAVGFHYPTAFQALARETFTAPSVEAFAMSPRNDFGPGEVVRFRVEGTPRAEVRVNVPGVVRLPLREVRPGVYVGRYIVRDDDDPEAFNDARVVLRSGNERVVVRVDEAQERHGYGYGR